MYPRAFVSCVIIFLYFMVSLQAKIHPALEKRKFAQAGNITLAGIFPVHVLGCGLENLRCKYVALSQAMVYAVDQINKDSYVLSNVTLGFEIYDSCLIDELAMEIALDILNRKKLSMIYASSDVCSYGLGKVPAVVGTGTSGGSILVSNLLQVENIPLVSYAATSDALSRKNTYPTFLRTVPPDRYQSQAMADLIRHFNWTYVAAIAADNDYGRSGIEYLKKSLSAEGTCLAMERYFKIDPQNMNQTRYKLSRILQELKSLSNVNVVVLYCTSSQTLHVFKEANKLKVFGKTWIASEGWGDDRRILRHTKIVKGLLGIVYRNIQVESYIQYLMSLTPKYKPVDWWKRFWLECTNNQSEITREIYDLKMHTQMSASVIEAVYAIAHALDDMLKCRDGGNCSVDKSHIDPKKLLSYLKRVNFTSQVSRVNFDSNGDRLGSYTIINLQTRNGSWEFSPVGSWEALGSPQLKINTENIQWNGDSKGQQPSSVCQEVCPPGYWQSEQVGCCWQCIKCDLDEISEVFNSSQCTKCPEDYIPNKDHTNCTKVPLIHISYTETFGYSFILVSCLGLIATAFVCGIFIQFNKSPVVKASNRELSYMLLFCIAMCYIAPFIYLAEPSKVGCILVQIWFYLFYTTCVAILAAKTNKIVLLFEERVPHSKYTGPARYRHIFFVVSALLFELVVIVIWVSVDPPRPYVNKSARRQYIHTCKPGSGLAGMVCSYILMSTLILASLFCCYFAYKARRLPDNFNEGKFIAFALYTLIISWLTFYPVFLNIQDVYTVIVLCATTVVSASGILVCLFLPKVYIILWKPEKNTKQYIQKQLTRHAFRLTTLDAANLKRRDPGPLADGPNFINTKL